MKVGEFFTTERIVMGGTGYCYAPVRLTGEVALLSNEVIPVDAGKVGGPEIQRFTFQFLRPGSAEIQLARFRSFDLSDVLYEDVLPFHVEPAGSNDVVAMVPGGWSPFTEVTPEDGVVFEKAMEGLVGVKDTPKRVSKQIVNGTNYRFFCYGEPATQGEHSFPAIVTIYAAPGSSKPQITGIQRVVL